MCSSSLTSRSLRFVQIRFRRLSRRRGCFSIPGRGSHDAREPLAGDTRTVLGSRSLAILLASDDDSPATAATRRSRPAVSPRLVRCLDPRANPLLSPASRASGSPLDAGHRASVTRRRSRLGCPWCEAPPSPEYSSPAAAGALVRPTPVVRVDHESDVASRFLGPRARHGLSLRDYNGRENLGAPIWWIR